MTAIAKSPITGASRQGALTRYFGARATQFEMCVYTLMDNFCPDYAGGYWDFYSLDNGGFFMSVSMDHRLRINNSMNGFDDRMSPEAASIGVNLIAINRLQWSEDLTQTSAAHLSGLFDKLRDYAFQRDEAVLIARFID